MSQTVKTRKRARIDQAVRKIVLEVSPDAQFESGADTLLRLGCLLYLERLASESRDTAVLDRKNHISAQVVSKAAKTVISDIRQF